MKRLLFLLLLIPQLSLANTWEYCPTTNYPVVYRLKVHEGWLIMGGFCVTYMADPDFEWKCENDSKS